MKKLNPIQTAVIAKAIPDKSAIDALHSLRHTDGSPRIIPIQMGIVFDGILEKYPDYSRKVQPHVDWRGLFLYLFSRVNKNLQQEILQKIVKEGFFVNNSESNEDIEPVAQVIAEILERSEEEKTISGKTVFKGNVYPQD